MAVLDRHFSIQVCEITAGDGRSEIFRVTPLRWHPRRNSTLLRRIRQHEKASLLDPEKTYSVRIYKVTRYGHRRIEDGIRLKVRTSNDPVPERELILV